MFKKRPKIKRIIERYKQELIFLGITAQQIILFGSYAKGHPRPDSDIDLIVISEDFKKLNLRERLEILGLAAGRVLEPIEALGYTSKEIKSEEKDSYIGNILTTASVVY